MISSGPFWIASPAPKRLLLKLAGDEKKKNG